MVTVEDKLARRMRIEEAITKANELVDRADKLAASSLEQVESEISDSTLMTPEKAAVERKPTVYQRRQDEAAWRSQDWHAWARKISRTECDALAKAIGDATGQIVAETEDGLEAKIKALADEVAGLRRELAELRRSGDEATVRELREIRNDLARHGSDTRELHRLAERLLDGGTAERLRAN